MDESARTRLATYGTLGPGKPNHHRVAGISGTWRRGTVRGRLIEAGWGAALGYPGLRLDPGGGEVAVEVLESPALPENWDRLDAFEGDGYRRVAARIRTEDGEVDACIYVLAEPD